MEAEALAGADSRNWQAGEVEGFPQFAPDAKGTRFVMWTGGHCTGEENLEDPAPTTRQGQHQDWLVIKFRVPEAAPGRYQLFIRTSHRLKDGDNDLWAGLIGQQTPIKRAGFGPAGQFTWSQGPAAELTAGVHAFYVAGRSSCMGVDQLAVARAGMPIDSLSANAETSAAVVRDSFEAYPLGPMSNATSTLAMWQVGGGSTDMARVDDSRSFSGKQSLHIKIPVTKGGNAAALLKLVDKALFPATQLHARIMFYLDGPPMGASPFHWSFMQMSGAFPQTAQQTRAKATFGVGGWYKSRVGGMQNVMGAHGTEGFMDCWNHAAQEIPTKTWVCLEWSLDSATHTQKLLIDGQPALELSYVEKPQASNGCLKFPPGTSWFVPPIDEFKLGYTQWHASDLSRNLWIDDVVVSKSAVGCPAPQ